MDTKNQKTKKSAWLPRVACTVRQKASGQAGRDARDGVEVETMNGTCFKGKFNDDEVVFLYKYIC